METEKLVKKAQKGDGEAFITLVKQYENVLYKVASRLLNNDEDAADAIQESILLAYKNINKLKNPDYFNSWICKILINKCNAILNKNSKIILVENVIAEKHHKNEYSKIELEEALNTLNNDYKTAILLYYIVGLNTKEISELVKEPEGTIKSRISRAKAILREGYFSDEGEILYGRK
ncbi:sigma-70 family RNA polymerase sigma factor [Clostridium hydrogenum]|uniref:sigma-70 family RNA polymerase sigma factor n=1 Tax=Clostridium hydrogenum TaxID=2855764 RepID=UPI001F34E604|nr:sigma-70 family RNA polymerase sigma factor [Clostridium hydrogenum]